MASPSVPLDPTDLERSSCGLKIRRPACCKISASSAFSSFLSHGSSCRRLKPPPPRHETVIRRPRIIHAVEPKIRNVEPAEFMQVVQMLTGSPGTSLKGTKQASDQAAEMHLLQQGTNSPQDSINYDELQQMKTTFLEVCADAIAGHDQFPSPCSLNSALINLISDNSTYLVQEAVSELPPACNDAINSTASYSLGSSLSSAGNNQQNFKLDHSALSSCSSDSAMPSNYTPCSPTSSFSATSRSDASWEAFFPEQSSIICGDGGFDDFELISVDSFYGSFGALDCVITSPFLFPATS